MAILKQPLLSGVYVIILSLGFSRPGYSKQLHELTQLNFDRVVNGSCFVFVLFYTPWDVSSVKATKSLEQTLDKLGEKNDNVILAKVNAYDEVKLATRYWIDHWPMCKFFLKGSVTPETYRGGLKPEDFTTFIKVISDTRINPSMYEQPVLELNNLNFERLIHDKKKNVFVLFYTSWCEACKVLGQTLRKVGENFKMEKDCILAKIDGDVNYDITLQQEISHYPTIKVYSLKNKDGYRYYPGKYQENWSEENITKFLNLQCKTKRTVMGHLDETAGRLDEFDRLVRIFMTQSFKRQELLNEAGRFMRTSDTNGSVDIYLKTMQRVLQDGAGYLTNELHRIERLLQASLHPSKADELQKRKNILQQFAKSHNKRDEL